MKAYLSVLALLTISLLACTQEGERENIILRDEMSLPKATSLQLSNPKDFERTLYLQDSMEYVALEITPLSMFTYFDKIQVTEDRVYILDISGIHHVYVFRRDGSFLHRIGSVGRGPGQYERLADFNVDGNQFVHLLDMQKKRILIYDADGNLTEEKKMPFRADSFGLLEDGYIFSIAKENPKKILLNRRLLVTDMAFKVEKEYFSYPEGYMDNKRNVGMFTRCSEGLLYNKPVSDSIFIFNGQGDLTNSFIMDFGNKKIPEDIKMDYAKVSENEEKYAYAYNTPWLVQDKLIGDFFLEGRKSLGWYDLNSNEWFQHEISPSNFTHKNLNFPLATIGNSQIVTYLEQSMASVDIYQEAMPQSLKSHMADGGYVLCIISLKNNVP